MKDFILRRTQSNDKSTLGHLCCMRDNGRGTLAEDFMCWTLEDRYRAEKN